MLNMLLYVAYMKNYSTQQVADFLEIDRVTLERAPFSALVPKRRRENSKS